MRKRSENVTTNLTLHWHPSNYEKLATQRRFESSARGLTKFFKNKLTKNTIKPTINSFLMILNKKEEKGVNFIFIIILILLCSFKKLKKKVK